MHRVGRWKLGGTLAMGATVALLVCSQAALADAVNVAPLGTATQSTDYPGYPASNALDANFGNFTHTNVPDAAPFWQVDLGSDYTIDQIVLYNRGDGCCPERLRDITVSVLDASGTVAAFTSALINPSPATTGPANVSLDLVALTGGPATGRIVRVTRTTNAGDPGSTDHDKVVIALGEVQVFVDSSTLPVSILNHPQGARKYIGGCHVFSVGLFNAGNAASLTYEWTKDDVELDGATGPRLIVGDIQPEDAGTYRVTVNADGNELTSDPAVLTVAGLNLALTGTATQSSTDFGGEASRAIDGNTSGQWGSSSLSHSANQEGASWQVELYGVSLVEKVVLWNRTDCCADRLSNFRVSALDSDGVEVLGSDFFTDVNTWPDTSVNGFEIALPVAVECRSIKVQRLGPDKNGANFMSLAEVEIFGSGPLPPPAALPNIARACGVIASQSSDAGYPATNALDGNFANFTHTIGSDPDPTWRVDFGIMREVAIVVLHNRTSCCGSRLRDITVSILDGTGALQWESPLLNPENELGAFPNGPAQLRIDLRLLNGGPVAGQIVQVRRTPDPDFSGGGDISNPDEASILSLGEVEIYEPPSWCPDSGDTHATDLAVDGPDGNIPGVYVATATATDDSADPILYTFTAQKTGGPPVVRGPQAANTAVFELDTGSWTVSVTVDDDELCLDAAADTTRSAALDVSVVGENLALGGTATQSSEYAAVSFPAALAVDGNLGNFSHTSETDPAPAWQVDLGGPAYVHAVLVHNRDDCCGSRLRDITVEVLDGDGDVLWASPLLNPENELGAYPLGPLSLSLNIALAAGGPVIGSRVRVTRTPDPDLSGTTGQGNEGEAATLALAEVQVYGTRCPETGDTHCSGVTVEATGEGFQYLATANASDESADPVSYTFTAAKDGSKPIVVGPQAGNTAIFDLTVGTWTVSVAVDDDACDDVADDAACSTQVVVAEAGIGPFRRADVNADGKVDLSDGVKVFNYLFVGGDAPTCLAAADANGQAIVNITSGIYILNYLFLGGPEPVAPFAECGRSSDPDDLAQGCEVPNAFCP